MKKNELANRKRNASVEIVELGQDYKKKYLLEHVIPKINSRKHKERTCHIHDLEYYDVTYNCIGISVKDLIGDKQKTFRNMLSSTHRAIVELTNLQSGGIGFINFDSDIAPYLKEESDEEIIDDFREFFLNLNMCTRRGCEKPYVTFNFGLDTSDSARKLTFLMLEAFEKGDEMGNPFVFPNMVFKLKSGVNLESGTQNNDLYQKALSVTAKRMIPTYFNCDSVSNRSYPSEEIGIMGCRTRVAANINGKEGAFNRGNIACITLNLVQMAYESVGNLKHFYMLLDENLEQAENLLLHRFETLVNMGDFKDYYEKKYYLDSEQKDARKMLKNGTLSIGFIGLWDAIETIYNIQLSCVEDMKKYYTVAYDVILHMKKFTDYVSEKNGMNFSLLASAAEGVTGNFAKYDSLHKGRGYRVCEKGYYTNSFHVPVFLETDYREKIDLEGEFHLLCNGGSITYIEMKEMPGRNIEAVQEIIEYAYKKDCNYIGINFPLDYCDECGYTGRIVCNCPRCKSDKIHRLRRVSGYLSEESSFTDGKKNELKERTSNCS